MPDAVSPIRRLVVLDGNAPWVRALFLAMPVEIDVRILHIAQPQVFKKLSGRGWLSARRWRRCGENASERWVIIPGWNKAPGVSAWLTRRAVRAAAGAVQPAAVVFALPQFAGVAEATRLRPRIYYAHDPFEFYEWDRKKTRALEARMLRATEAAFAISKLLRDDLQARAIIPVYYSPNAVSSDFIARMHAGDGPLPADLAAVRGPIVGCIGQINETYDWSMLGQLVSAMSDISFAFIGPVAVASAETAAMIDGVLKGRPNVHWLGAKMHDELPDYLRGFDVCLNPLAPGAHADRRSPLRLYDFLATGKPVVSTAIHEASSHEEQVWIGRDAVEMESLIRSALSGQRRVDAEIRNEYLRRSTWQYRARKLLKLVDQIAPKKSGVC